jgi:hypothetical protein
MSPWILDPLERWPDQTLARLLCTYILHRAYLHAGTSRDLRAPQKEKKNTLKARAEAVVGWTVVDDRGHS